MAVTLDSVEHQLLHSLDQIRSLSTEIGNMNSKFDYLNNGRIANKSIIEELRSANRQLVDRMAAIGGASSVSRGPREIKLIDMKVMNPKKFDGEPDSPYRAWVKSVRAYCNASRHGFRKSPRWAEVQSDPMRFPLGAQGSCSGRAARLPPIAHVR